MTDITDDTIFELILKNLSSADRRFVIKQAKRDPEFLQELLVNARQKIEILEDKGAKELSKLIRKEQREVETEFQEILQEK